MRTLYTNIPYITSGLIIVFIAYAFIYLKLSKKKFTESEEKAIKKFKKLGSLSLLLAVLNILYRFFISE